jgi:hypothetical protein
MKLAWYLADAIYRPRVSSSAYVSIGEECFGLEDGSMLCWRGVNYVRKRPPWRARLANWLIANL